MVFWVAFFVTLVLLTIWLVRFFRKSLGPSSAEMERTGEFFERRRSARNAERRAREALYERATGGKRKQSNGR